jgi:diacylglycerol kinase (ATP)
MRHPAEHGGERRAAMIVNTRSRRGRDLFPLVRQTLLENGFQLSAALALKSTAQVVAETEKASQQGIPLVIIGGGDGTLGAVAHCFVGSSSILGVLPLGTGNQFARELGITVDVETACRVLIEGKAVEVDLGVAGSHYFLTVATVGMTTRIAQELTAEAKRRFGLFVYVIALARALPRVRPFRATLTTPEGKHTFETIQVVIGNGRYHAGYFPLAPDASITDGKLVVYAIPATSRWELLRFALHLPGGHHVELPEVPAVATTIGTLETRPIQRVTVDGEIVLRTPLDFRVAPKALCVMAPRDFKG